MGPSFSESESMRYIKDLGTVKLNEIACKGLPTLSAGSYHGHFIGVTKDSEDEQWVTVAAKEGTHIENTELDLSGLTPNCAIRFKIAPVNGCIAVPKGNYYKLIEGDKDVTKFMPLQELYVYIKDNNIKLAELKISEIIKVD